MILTRMTRSNFFEESSLRLGSFVNFCLMVTHTVFCSCSYRRRMLMKGGYYSELQWIQTRSLRTIAPRLLHTLVWKKDKQLEKHGLMSGFWIKEEIKLDTRRNRNILSKRSFTWTWLGATDQGGWSLQIQVQNSSLPSPDLFLIKSSD